MNERVPIFGLGLTSKSPNVSSQRRVNLYLELRPEGDKTRILACGTPGLTQLIYLGDTPIRGLHGMGNFLYVVHKSNFWEVNNAGIATLRGTLNSTTGRVYFADNNIKIMMTDGVNGYYYTTNPVTTTLNGDITTAAVSLVVNSFTNFPATASYKIVIDSETLNVTAGFGTTTWTVTRGVDGTIAAPHTSGTTVTISRFNQITDVDYVPGNTVTWQDRYFIQDQVNSGRFYISAIDDPSSWDALDFANAEGSPDNNVRIFADHGELLPFGEVTTEFWGNSGALDFPYVRLGSAVVEWGLAARESLTKFDNSLMFLARNRMGESQVVLLNGYTPTPVGDYDFLTAINKYSQVNDATAFSYMRNGHAFYQINFPSANASWLYDGASKTWSELQSDTGRHRSNMGTLFLGKVVTGDYANGTVYRIDDSVYTDNGAMITREIISRHFYLEDYMPISRLWLDVETGVGLTSGQGVDPQIMLQYSKDGGHSWSIEVWRSLGKIGEYKSRAYWNRLGSSKKGWTFKARITDPIKVEIMNEGWIDQ